MAEEDHRSGSADISGRPLPASPSGKGGGSGLLLILLMGTVLIAWSSYLHDTVRQAHRICACLLVAQFILLVVSYLRRRRIERLATDRADALTQSEDRFEALAAHSRTLLWEISPEGRYTYISRAVTDVLGFAPEEIIGRTYFYDLHPEAGRDEHRRKMFALMQENQPIHDELNPMVSRDGKTVWVATHGFPKINRRGKLIGYQGSDRDVTEWRRAQDERDQSLSEAQAARRALLSVLEDERRSQEERQRLAAAMEQAVESVIITDIAGRILYVNPAFEKVSGYSREEALGKTPQILKSGRQDAPFYRAMWETLLAGQPWSGRFVNRRKDGAFYTEDATISPIRDNGGRIVNFVAVKRDISEHLKLTHQLQQSQKLESIGRLAGGVAHDLNNSLQVIGGYVEMAVEQLDAQPAIRDDLREAQKAVERSANLTRQLLAFARKQTALPRVIHPNDLIENLLKMLRRLIGEHIQLIWTPHPDAGNIFMDPGQMEQILANLCVNARDALAGVEKPRIEISTRPVRPDPAAATPPSESGAEECVEIRVSDNGCGMTPDVMERLFEPFFTTKGLGEGTGLGLATVFGIVKQNHGDIHVRSEPGKGTTFEIALRRHTVALPSKTGDTPGPVRRGRGEGLLIVEDREDILKPMVRHLEQTGYRVFAAATAQDALRLVASNGMDIRLLLTDILMPEMCGPDLVKEVQRQHPHIRALFMSGNPEPAALRTPLDPHIRILGKPFTHTQLSGAVHEALD